MMTRVVKGRKKSARATGRLDAASTRRDASSSTRNLSHQTLSLSHDLVLGDPAVVVRFHVVAAAGLTRALLVEVLGVAQLQRTTTVLVALELRNGSLGRVGVVEPDDTGTARATAWLILDLGLLDLANRSEQLDQVRNDTASRTTYVADVDSLVLLETSSDTVGERVGRHGLVVAAIEAARAAAVPTTTEATAEATTARTAKSAATVAAETATATKATTAAAKAAAKARVGEAVLANLEHAALPLVTVELLDGVASVLGGLEHDNAGSLRAAIRAGVNIGANNAADTSCMS
jgi:hypothetical protein